MLTAEMTIAGQIAEIAKQGEQLMFARRLRDEVKAAQAAAARAQEIAEQWQPILECVRDLTPAWMHEYLSTPDEEPSRYLGGSDQINYLPVTLSLPGCAPVYIYVMRSKHETCDMRYVAGHYKIAWSEFSGRYELTTQGGGWRDRYDWGDDAADDLAIAIHLARQEHQRLPELTAEIERRNAERDLDQMPDAQPTSKSRLEQAEAAVEAGDYQQAIALALLALVERQGD